MKRTQHNFNLFIFIYFNILIYNWNFKTLNIIYVPKRITEPKDDREKPKIKFEPRSYTKIGFQAFQTRHVMNERYCGLTLQRSDCSQLKWTQNDHSRSARVNRQWVNVDMTVCLCQKSKWCLRHWHIIQATTPMGQSDSSVTIDNQLLSLADVDDDGAQKTFETWGGRDACCVYRRVYCNRPKLQPYLNLKYRKTSEEHSLTSSHAKKNEM